MAAVVAFAAGLASARPASDPPAERGAEARETRGSDNREGRDGPVVSPDLLRERLEARLAELDAQREALAGAIGRLDAGAAPIEVIRGLRREGAGPDRGASPLARRLAERRGADPADGAEGARGAGGAGGAGVARGAEGAEGSAVDPRRLIELVRQRRPELAERLERLLESDPERFRRAMAERRGHLRALLDGPAPPGPAGRPGEANGPRDGGGPDGELIRAFRDAESRVAELAREASAGPADDPARAEAVDRLRAGVRELHMLRLRGAERRLDMLRDQIARLEARIERTRAGLDEDVARTVEELLADPPEEGRGPRPDRPGRGGGAERDRGGGG